MSFKLREHIAISDSGVLFNTHTGESFSVNETGMLIVGELRKHREKSDIEELLLKEFEADAEAIKEDLEDFLQFLMQNHLVERKA